ncbi:Dual specificity protein phosphatase 16-like [Oopsacas minuta]|uniref:protein-tyrosine-phosphatase n=1 Tax=Oopsacas minuta TaxID=111878 RepID=A0AAV7KI87_9METZ|nr:Dual specificity protein phosphatase 16-like [Oopsacas minuta]
MESRVTPRDIFNLPIFEFYWLIDLRQEKAFKEGHICSAFNFPCDNLPKSNEDRTQILASFIHSHLESGLLPAENFSPVVLYGDETSICNEAISWMVERLQHLKHIKTQLTLHIPETTQTADYTSKRTQFEKFIDQIVNRTSAVWVLEGGYSSFQVKYPFLCHLSSIMDLYPLPHEIADQVYMGSRPMNLPNSLKDLGITHLILSTDKYQKLITQIGFDLVSKIQVLNIEMEDFAENNVIQLWRGCHEFINSAIISPQSSVLVLFEGRSRSASILISWLVASRGCTVHKAIDYVKSIAPAVDTNLIFSTYMEALVL